MSSRLKLAGICVAAAFALAACGGGGSALDSARAERDRLAALLAQVTQARDDALAQVTTLRGQLDTANQNLMDKQSELDTANQNLMDKQSELDTANQDLMNKQAEVDRLVGDQDVAAIRAKDPADRTQAEQQLLDAVDARDAAQGDVTRLTGERDDANEDVTRLQGELDTANGRVRELEGQLRAANSVSGLFEAAATTYTSGTTAVSNAKKAVADAIKYAGMLTAEAVKGESATAVTNAQNILDAETAANNAVMAAEQALADAKAAKTTAMSLDDSATKTALIAALDAAIKDAESKIMEAKAARDAEGTDPAEVDSLNEAVAAVKGDNKLAEGYPMMPAAIGKRIAGEVMTALTAAAPGTNGTITDATSMDGIKHDGAAIGAMTWAMIVGDDNIMKKRLGTIDSSGALTVGNAEVSVTSLEGMTATDVTATSLTDGIINADGGTTPGSYKGILGAVVCLGGSDGCEVTNGILGAGWYFSPAAPTELYVADPDMAGMYMAATMYATYGYWLTYTDGAASGITLYSATTAPSVTLDLGQAGEGADARDVTATYSGSAVGISKRGDASGQFTADVNLIAKFAVAPTLRGSISNFQGNAVGSWTVLLNENALAGTASFTDGTTAGGGAAGVWTAQGYGPGPVDTTGDGTPNQNQRPTGFHGRFSANFGDGAAAGAYTTRAD